ncbi:universal stress protein [uncultured Lutibacter sp.]|mgnify:CR=1 FL=1|uniref:universal stress protein n=1 Tax=uncultured Lutibacter sp. TaxID=437739 RepID=UPI00260CBC1B|nr:universal stress protein [uncultured Lutibacter sp.]
MKTILVPLGNSEKAINTLQYAIDFATVSSAKIYVVQVFGSAKTTGHLKNIDAILEKDTKDELAHILSKVDSKNIIIKSIVVKGSILDVISRAAEELDIDLIISSAYLSTADSSIYLGEIVGGIVKQTELPMLIIPKGYVFKPIKNILLGLRSGLIKKEGVLDPLKNIVTLFKAKVNLLHVITPYNTLEDNSLHQNFKEVADTIFNSENATVYQGVLEHLIEINPDMMCVIRNKRGFLIRLLEQNTIKKIDFESRVPLLVLKGNL